MKGDVLAKIVPAAENGLEYTPNRILSSLFGLVGSFPRKRTVLEESAAKSELLQLCVLGLGLFQGMSKIPYELGQK
jgi:hypothetical protein